MLGHLDIMVSRLWFLALSTAFSLGREFRCVYKNNCNMKQALSSTNVEPRCCCDTSGNGIWLFQLILHASGDISGDLEELVRF